MSKHNPPPSQRSDVIQCKCGATVRIVNRPRNPCPKGESCARVYNWMGGLIGEPHTKSDAP